MKGKIIWPIEVADKVLAWVKSLPYSSDFVRQANLILLQVLEASISEPYLQDDPSVPEELVITVTQSHQTIWRILWYFREQWLPESFYREFITNGCAEKIDNEGGRFYDSLRRSR